MMEALVCHPLGRFLPFLSPLPFPHTRNTPQSKTNPQPDTIKVRMQLSRRARAPGAKKRGFVATGAEIVKRETPLGLYKGLGAVITGIVPKMAIRFTSFEAYKKMLANKETGIVSGQATFLGEFSSVCFLYFSCSLFFWLVVFVVPGRVWCLLSVMLFLHWWREIFLCLF